MTGNKEFQFIDNWDPEKKERALMILLQEVPPEVVRAARRKRSERVPIQQYIEQALEIKKHVGKVQGLSTGFKGTDDLSLGMTPGELIVLSGPPSSGKTQMATHWAYYNAHKGHKVLFVTMEMTKPQITERFMGVSETDLSELSQGIIEYQKEDELKSVDINYLVSDAVKSGTELVIIDHLQYFSDDGDENEARQLGRICKDFKLAAVKCEIPVVLIVHIVKLADGKKPTGNDLRGSSLIRQHADQLILVYRDQRPGASVIEANTVEVTNWKNRLRGLRPGHRKAVFYAEGPKLSETRPQGNSDQTTIWNEKEAPEIGGEFEIELDDDPFADTNDGGSTSKADNIQDNVSPGV